MNPAGCPGWGGTVAHDDCVLLSLWQDLQKCQSKVSKYQERDRTGTNVVKLDAVSHPPPWFGLTALVDSCMIVTWL